MKSVFQKLAALVLVLLLVLSMTGCDKLDYRDAVDLYNARNYKAAAELFYALGDYKDSAALYTRCHYWMAVDLMEAGRYQEALPRFVELSDYEDCAQRVIECIYQMAVAAFDSGDLKNAETYFLQTPDYKQSQEYLRQITWQKFFEELASAGTLQTQQEDKVFRVTADPEANQLVFFVSQEKDMTYRFYDDLTLTLSRDSKFAAFTATSTFTMGFKGSQIGSTQAGTGTVDISKLATDTVLALATYEKTTTDNQGNTSTTEDPAESLMNADMAENLQNLLAAIPGLLADAGITLTLQNIGFSPL